MNINKKTPINFESIQRKQAYGNSKNQSGYICKGVTKELKAKKLADSKK